MLKMAVNLTKTHVAFFWETWHADVVAKLFKKKKKKKKRMGWRIKILKIESTTHRGANN
jgi:hypothetical protein